MYIEINEDFSTKYQTYIIAFCPDTDQFYISNERYFWLEFEKEFSSSKEAMEYIKNNREYFINKRNEFAEVCGGLIKNMKTIFIDDGSGLLCMLN